MTHFAKLNAENEVVIVLRGRQEDDGQEEALMERTGDVYKQTSYNTRGGVYYDPETGEPTEDQSKMLRMNFAAVGMVYDEALDAFYMKQPFPSWTLDTSTCLWNPPVPMPEDGFYHWDEETRSWVSIPE